MNETVAVDNDKWDGGTRGSAKSTRPVPSLPDVFYPAGLIHTDFSQASLSNTSFLYPSQYGYAPSVGAPDLDQLYDVGVGMGVGVGEDALHDELLQMCRATGIEDIAKEAGVIKNGEIPVLKDYLQRDNLMPTPKKTTKPVPYGLYTHTDIRMSTNPNILSHSNHKPTNHNTNPPSHADGNKLTSNNNSSANCNTSNSPYTTASTNGINNNVNSTSTTSTLGASANNTNASASSTGNLSRQSSFQNPLHSSNSSLLSPSGDESGDESVGKKRKRLTDSKSSQSSAMSDKDDKHGKGLRHFSGKVRQKVETKRVTSYNEVADELVGEFAASSETEVTEVEQKNIRRRVYDVLNVLMAMNIISKDKKEIHWLGLPTESKKPFDEYKKEKLQRLERIKRKRENLAELMAQQVSYRNLLARNTKTEHSSTPMKNRIYLPFIVVNTKSSTVINCEVAHDRTKYFFNFSNPFEIYDDNEVLKRMGLGSCTYNDEPATENSTQFPRTNLNNAFPPT